MPRFMWEIAFSDMKKGPGVWKFNNMYLEREDFITGITEIVQQSNKIPHIRPRATVGAD